MSTKEKIKKEIDRLSDAELEKVYLYLSSLKKPKKTELNIRSLKLGGKLDNQIDDDAEQAWIDEIKRRKAEIKSGKAIPISGEKVHKAARELLNT